MPSANSSLVAYAFRNRTRAKGNNTHCDGNEVHLHGNRIAWYDENNLPWISFAGWATPTTLSRIDAILGVFNLRSTYCFRVKRDGTLILNGAVANDTAPFPLSLPLF